MLPYVSRSKQRAQRECNWVIRVESLIRRLRRLPRIHPVYVKSQSCPPHQYVDMMRT